MKIYKYSDNTGSLKSLIFQLQLTIEFSQIKEILFVYRDLLVLITNYSFLFEGSSSEIPALKENPVYVETAFFTQDPARDRVNWWIYCGDGESVNLGENTISALKNSPEHTYNQKALREGTAKSKDQRYGVDLTKGNDTYHVGDTVVTYDKSESSKYRVVTYHAFNSDGFWDIYSNKGDGIGPKKELQGGTPYSYIPYTWTEVYKK